MKVLHIGKYYPPHMGGMEIHLQQLITRQAKRLHVEAVVANDTRRTSIEMLDGAKITRVARFGVVASMPLTLSLPVHIRRSRADLIHLHMPNPGAAFAFMASGHRAKVIVTHHADTLGREHLRKISDPFVRGVMNRASAVIVGSRRYLESSDELAPFRDKCVLIPMGIRSEFFREPDPGETAQIKSRYGNRIVLAVGRLVPYKGFEYLIRAMTNVRGKLLLVGTGPLQDSLVQCIRDTGVGDKVEMVGRIGDAAILSYYHAASVFVMPSISRAEAFGLVQVEAMASGVPVVNTDIPSGVPEVSIDGKTGFTVRPKDSIALARAINQLLDSEDLRTQFGSLARRVARDEYSFDAIAEKTTELYERVVRKARVPASETIVDRGFKPSEAEHR